MSKQHTVSIPATVANVGPGFDVLGLCVTGLADTMTGELQDGPSVVTEVTGVDADSIPKEPTKNCAVIAAEAYLRANSCSQNLSFAIARQIPLSGGLGSSAAASVGGALLAATCLGKEHAVADIMQAALVGEAAVAGRHLDNIAACALGGFVAVRDTESVDVVGLGAPAELFVAVVTPAQKLDTKASRAALPTTLPTKTWTQQMANCTALAAAIWLKDWNLLRRSLHDHFAEPGRGPLIPDFSAVKDAALGSGALGCSISGGGPSIFAITTSRSQAEACAEAMAAALTQPPRLSHVGAINPQGAHAL